MNEGVSTYKREGEIVIKPEFMRNVVSILRCTPCRVNPATDDINSIIAIEIVLLNIIHL